MEKRAWNDLLENFLGNKKADNYKKIVAEMILTFHAMKVNMSLKIHFLHNHFDFFHQIWVNSVMNMMNMLLSRYCDH